MTGQDPTLSSRLAMGWRGVRIGAVRLIQGCALLATLWAFARVLARGGPNLVPDGDVELVVMHWSGETGQEENAIVEASLRRFEASRPGVRVRRINPGDAGSFYTKLQTMMAAGEPPDLFYVGAERLPAFVVARLLEPLEPYLEQGEARLRLEDYFPATVAAFRHDGQRAGQGALYGIPKDFTPVGFYYNKDLLARAGQTPPPDDWTWDDFHRIAQAVGELEGCTGAEFVTWPFVVRAYLLTEGIDVADPTFTELRLREPAARAALERLYRWRHVEANTLTSGRSKIAEGPSVFLTGKVGLAGPFGRWVVPNYRSIPSREQGGFEWDFAPLPRGQSDHQIVLPVAWCLAKASRHKPEAFELLRYLVDEESQAAQARLGLAMPSLIKVAASPAFLDPNLPPANDLGYFRAAERASFLEWPPDPRFEDLMRTRLDRALKSGEADVETAIQDLEQAWGAQRASPLEGQDFPALPWKQVGLGAAATLTLLLCVFVWALRRRALGPARRSEQRWGYLLASPWLIGALVFLLGPILLSALLSLARWQGITSLGEARWVGLANYTQLFHHDARFARSLDVTVYYTLLAVPLGQIAALGAALLMNRKLPGIYLLRAAWYLPSVLAGVGIAILWRWVFDPDAGPLNALLAPLCELFGRQAPEWFGRDAALFGPPAFALMSLWFLGGTMMIYLAGLQAIPNELYEAAAIDGAGPLRRFWSITLPILTPVLVFNTIMALIGSFQVFTQAYVMTGGEPGDATRFYVLYLYNQAFEFYEMGYASAMAWILLVIILALTALVLWVSKGRMQAEVGR
jgi:ABC-type sugar transport system permease subunit/ABC-type glycerol-3-phosphate transport system substrate-binding protein